MNKDQIEATFLIPINEFSSLQDKITAIKRICKNNDANASFEHDGIEIHVGPDYDVGEVLSRFYAKKDAQNKKDMDKLKVYIAALFNHIDTNCTFGHPHMGEARENSAKIYDQRFHSKMMDEIISKIAEGEFNP